MIERLCIIGMITCTELLDKIAGIYNPVFFESASAKRLGQWVMQYYKQYQKAPNSDIEKIYYSKVDKLQPDVAESIEMILRSLGEEAEGNDPTFLIDTTLKYFEERKLLILKDNIEALVSDGKIDEAKKEIDEFDATLFSDEVRTDIDLSKKESMQYVTDAFSSVYQPVIRYPRQLGDLFNDELIPGAFVAFMGPEKRGKTQVLLELGMRAARQGKNVAFFQAGDMNENSQLRRVGIYLTKKSDKEKYCKEHYEPVRDCILNQTDQCDRKERECDYGVFPDKSGEYLRKEVSKDELVEMFESCEDYQPCCNCPDYYKNQWGAVWLKKVEAVEPLDEDEALVAIRKFFVRGNRKFKISTHPNGTLSTAKANKILDKWQKDEGFIADLIMFDYADIMQPTAKVEFRHQQNQIWKDLRGMSQTKRDGILPLVVTVTQTDADSYERDLITLKNFSEDKRKFGHVTALYGLNQDKKGREKKIGILRINELVKREGEYDTNKCLYICQNLKRGRAFLHAFW